jgi:hypothetical protein
MTNFRRLGASEARAIAEALGAMARADGVVDPREEKVIDRFLKECAAPWPEPGWSASGELTLSAATDGLRDSFLCTCALLAFADGDFTAEEAVLLRRYAAEIGVSEARLEELVGLVERDQALPQGPPALQALMDVLSAWSHEHLPSLRAKVVKLFGL